MISNHLDKCLSKLCSACETLENGIYDDYTSSDNSNSSDDSDTESSIEGSECELAKYDKEYASKCTECNCPASYNNLKPLVGPISRCCESDQDECHKLKKKAQQKWTIRHTGGNVKDWWDRISLIKDTISQGDNITYPKRGDTVEIDYVGKLLNGNSFGWSRKPLRFRIGDNTVISGLNKGLKKMSLGEKAKLYMPAEMAYGWVGTDSSIPPDSDLVMTITLLRLQKRGFIKRQK